MAVPQAAGSISKSVEPTSLVARCGGKAFARFAAPDRDAKTLLHYKCIEKEGKNKERDQKNRGIRSSFFICAWLAMEEGPSPDTSHPPDSA